jgi:hypothetical protein
MTYRHSWFLIILFYQGVILYNQISAGDHLAGYFELNSAPHRSDPSSDFNKGYLNDQDTIKSKIAQPATDFSSDMEIQVGAFLRENNATALRMRLSDLLNHKVIIVQANGYYKVRVIGCKTIEEMGKLVEMLGFLGIKNVWVFHSKPTESLTARETVKKDSANKDSVNKLPVDKDTVKKDSANKEEKTPGSNIAQETSPAAEPTINLQVGVFHSKSEARKAKRVIESKLNLPVEIVREWEYYIVFVTGFKTREEIFIYYPKLAALGYPDSFMYDKNKPRETNK